MLNVTTPARVRHGALVVFTFAAPLALTVLIVWALRLWPPLHARPHLVVMVYLLLLAITMGAAIIVAVAHCQITVSRAFAAGVRAVRADDTWPADPAAPTPLRVVE